MSALKRLIDVHRPIGIYDIKEGSNIYGELSVYASELDRLEAYLQKACLEAFTALACDEGLSLSESIWGKERGELDTELRRSMILARYSLKAEDFGVKSLKKLLDVMGIEGQVLEYPRQFKVELHTLGSHTQAERKWIRSQAEALFPAHLDITVVFEGFSFEESDRKMNTFDNMESKNMCWSDIDIYCTA